jgi:hypothetical protein
MDKQGKHSVVTVWKEVQLLNGIHKSNRSIFPLMSKHIAAFGTDNKLEFIVK